MFTEDELEDYNELFLSLGVKDRKVQKELLGFLYTLGTIAYKQIP